MRPANGFTRPFRLFILRDMPVFEYTALDLKGKTTTGIIDAESVPVARQRLRAAKTYPVTIHKVAKESSRSESHSTALSSVLARVSPNEVCLMTRQLATLVGAGFPLVTALDALVPQTKSKSFKRILAQTKDAIIEGNSFANALARYPSVFSSLYVNMVRAGEASGTLEIVLDQLAELTEKQQALKNRIQTAMAYPILMSLIGLLVIFLLVTFIIPNITSIFTDMHQVLPAPTRVLIAVSGFFRYYWWIILLALAGVYIGIRHIRRTVRGRFVFDKIVLSLPLFGILSRKLAVARFARTLGSLLANGVSLLIALDIVKNIAGNTLISRAIAEASVDVGKGRGLGAALAVSKTLPQLAIQMIQVGEQSGELERMLEKIATVYENEVEASVMRLTSLLEPLMILMMGVILGFIVLSICLPIFEMNQLVM